MNNIPMHDHFKALVDAVKKTIAENHAKGLPVYQAKDGHIIAIYPDGREVRLQKILYPKGQ